jgi:hypothetical protein
MCQPSIGDGIKIKAEFRELMQSNKMNQPGTGNSSAVEVERGELAVVKQHHFQPVQARKAHVSKALLLGMHPTALAPRARVNACMILVAWMTAIVGKGVFWPSC